ncbi:hypothetical protein I302_105443 [Kwoniella bestiolae CBS 10118]|uniref:Autophagy-related protein 2 n=1 Tax=Kwoniella bestiolae CBS 10118 TaxID=1296100 RepID=A0A1B9FT41_9TREE|nr:hypothetical protein I302_08724 [Kwoniella bestiolae CBS 10118]OCF21944.1 hypothetical protein I302_08724 [Kwoniella bestiolae CBS 10118]
MFSLPAFLTTFPFTLPSLPSISLPANIQRRFLSYVLKRSLGRFVKDEALDAERIQAQLSQGWVELEGLEVDTNEINSLIPQAVPLIITSGTLSKVTARVPVSNLWSDPLCLTVDTLNLSFVLSRPSPISNSKGKTPSSTNQRGPHHDLAESVTSAADDFLHEELDAYEEAELDRSIRQSLVLNATDPFSNDEVPGSFPFGGPTSPGLDGQPLPATVESTTVLAGLVERILARLEFKIKNIKIQIRFDDEDHGGIFEVRVAEIKYADETSSQAESSENDNSRTTIRSIRLSGVTIHMLPIPTAVGSSGTPSSRPTFSTSSRSSSISSNSTASSSGGEYQDMMMSQAVVDLRESTMSDLNSDASVYLSAMSEKPAVSSPGIPEKVINEEDSSRSATPTPTSPVMTPKDRLLLTFGSEDIVLRMKTTRQLSPSSYDTATSPGLPSSPTLNKQPPNPTPSRLPSIDIDVSIGTIASVILPEQAAIILSALQYATVGTSSSNSSNAPASPASGPQAVNQPQLTARVRLRALYASVIYDMSASSDPHFASDVVSFWAKPSTTFIPNGHLRVRLDTLEAHYASEAFTVRNQTITRPHKPNQPSTTRLPRRTSTITRPGPPPPTLSITLQDASIFEYLASDTTTGDPSDIPPGGAFPVLLFDTILPRQYDVAPGVSSSSLSTTLHRPEQNGRSPVFPEFDSVDWRNSGLQRKAGGSEKQWKVKQKGKGILKGAPSAVTEADEGPVMTMKKDLVPNSTASIIFHPIHVFFDLSLVERLLPMLRSIAPAIRSTPDPVDPPPPFGMRSYHRPQEPIRQRTTESIIDDLDAQASSYSTIQATSATKPIVDIKCPLVRLDIRCPAPINRRGTWGDGGHLRSGIVTLDMHHLRAKVSAGGNVEGGSSRKSEKGQEDGTMVMWEKMVLFFSRAPERRSSAFIVIGPLAPDPTDFDISPILPSVELRSSTSPTETKTTKITCRIPSVQAKIKQKTIEGLQFFADDITHWLDGAFGDGSAPKPRDDLKMIGSRFFGAPGSTRGSSSASSSTEDEDDSDLSATILKLEISETDISLYAPRLNGGERVLALKASDMDIKVESNVAGRHEMVFNLSLMDADFSDKTESDNTNPTKILGRTTPYTLTSQPQPLVQLRFSSLTNVTTSTKETGISVTLTCLTFYLKSVDWVIDLARFAKTPEGVFEDVVPSEVTRIKLLLQDCSIHATTPTLGGAVVVVLGSVDVRTDMRSDGDDNEIKCSAGRLAVLAVDDLGAVGELGVGVGDSAEVWRKAGYAQLIEISSVDLQCLRDLTGTGEVLLAVLQVQARITACADSLASFGGLVGDFAKLVPSKSTPPKPVRSPTTLDRSINVFDSIDEQAFNLIPDIVSGADMIEDDLPTNLDYLDRASRLASNQPTLDKATGESLRSWQTDDGEGELGGETIKILLNEGFDMDENYWDSLPVLNKGYDDELQIGKTRIRINDCNIKILLHDGYDWQRTRKAIEDEIRAVRKRLEKIRQLLASGQKADESIDFERSTKSVLFNSIYIGLEGKNSSEMNHEALIAAIDEELDDMNENDTQTEMESTASSWQTLPGLGPTRQSREREHKKSSKTRLKGKKLTRSKKPQIEINLTSLRSSVDLFPSSIGEDKVSSKVEVKVREMEILDHIRTSTWKKFLMSMKSDNRGNVRETDSDMVRVELKGIRLEDGGEEELRLRAKILPLRLHVDQDALDFLKRFFSFKSPSPSPQSIPNSTSLTSPTKATDPFFQHVEIFPIELKLDYKPKRVDFAALREGKTIELMNFFHFDGAEMTLRHITLSGITGWDRLGTTLQDLWTPDVKANQLADVISGVSPIRSIVNVGSGVADLILLPIEQYRKDGRLAKGVQRGTNSFVKSTAMEMMKLGARLATGTQIILEKAENVLGAPNVVVQPITSSSSENTSWERGEGEGEGTSSEDEDDIVSRYANQPEGVRQGVQAAYKSLSKNVNAAAQTILAVPMEVYERSGDDGPLRAVVRAVPIAVLKPMIGTTEAVSKTLLGMRNSLDPSARTELGDKYK